MRFNLNRIDEVLGHGFEFLNFVHFPLLLILLRKTSCSLPRGERVEVGYFVFLNPLQHAHKQSRRISSNTHALLHRHHCRIARLQLNGPTLPA
jgi:hypothetical protein